MAQSNNVMVNVDHPENPEYNGARNPDDALWVRFYSQPRHNEFKSDQEQRPVFDDVVYVEIHTPGNNLNIIQTPARDIHKQRFPRQWANFKNTNGEDGDKNGTPLSAWPVLTPAFFYFMGHMYFYTVEQIAFASDDQIQKIGMHVGMSPIQFRLRANNFLKLAKDSAINDKQAAEIAALKAKDEARDKEMAELRAMLEQKTAPAAKSTETLGVPKKAA